jgi:Cu2+-exporting ATPase
MSSVTPTRQAELSPQNGPALPLSAGLPDAQDEAHARLSVLDDASEWSSFSREQKDGPGCWESNVLIEGMHCAACALSIEDALKRVPGVLQAEVSAGSHRAKVVWAEQQVAPSRWMQAVAQAGYRALPANDAFARERRQQESRRALWRMMVAGLCMMQVMMYAYPAYIAEPGDLSPEFEHLLRWACWVLSLPVILFSCGPFFKNAWRDVMQRQISMDLPVALGMLITFGVSTAGTFDPQGLFGHEVYFDSLTMFVFFLLTGRWFELRLRDQTAGSLEILMNRLPDTVARQLPDGGFERVTVRRVAVGDVLQVLPGESFPADGILVRGQTSVDESLLTGESRPVSKATGEEVISGSHNLGASVLARVERVGEQTRFAQIVRLMESASTSKPRLAVMADRIAKPFLLGVLVAAGLSCAYWWPTDPERALMVAVAVLVVTCPCALSLATPAAMLSAAGALARRGLLVRNLSALEALSEVDMVVFDKTGTLTRDALSVHSITTRASVSESMALAAAAALARHSLHPVSKALVLAAREADSAVVQAREVEETSGQGLSGWLVLPDRSGMTARGVFKLGSADFCAVEVEPSPGSQVHLADEAGWVASFGLQEDVRADAEQTVQLLKAAGLQVHLLSGDASAAAKRVGDQLGIDLSKGQCTPQDKLDLLVQYQREGHKVAVVGDGLNDGPVLAGAHVSFAFGQAVPLAQAQADFLVMGSRLVDVVWAVRMSRLTLRVVRQNLWWAAIYNLICVPLAVVGWLPAWLAGLGMAGSSLLVVLNALRLARVEPMQESV